MNCRQFFLIPVIAFCLFGCAKNNEADSPVTPHFKSIAPSTAGGGDTVTITGDHLTSGGSPSITINGKRITIIQSTADAVKIVIPAHLGSGPSKVTLGGTSYDGPYFHYKYKATVTTLSTGFSYNCPWGITDAGADLYLAETYGRGIYVINKATGHTEKIEIPTYIGEGGNFYSPYNIAFDAVSRNIYVTDFNRHAMRVASGGGMSLIYDVDHNTTTTGIAVGPDGFVYMSNNIDGTITKFDPVNGYNYSTFTTGLVNPRNIFFGKDGKMYVAAFDLSLGPVVQQIGTDGKAKVVAKDLESKGWEIAVDDAGNFYEADHFSNTLRMIEPDGTVTVIAGSGTAADVDGVGFKASFNGPQGLTIGADGVLYMTTYNYDTRGGNKIRKIVVE